MRKILRVGTWNVQTMLQLGKVRILGNALERNRVDIIMWSIRGWMERTRTLHNHRRAYHRIFRWRWIRIERNVDSEEDCKNLAGISNSQR